MPTDRAQKTIPVKLINSGRGIEAWLERAGSAALIDSSSSSSSSAAKISTQAQSFKMDHNGERLILSHGPLSYEYKLFKIELHSASASANRFAAGQSALAAANQQDREADNEENNDKDDSGINPNDDNGGGGDGAGSTSAVSSNEILPEALRGAPKSSEHLIDGRSFEAELQLHFYNRHLASSAQEALRLANEQPQASLFAVISVLISLKRPQQQLEPGAKSDQASWISGRSNHNQSIGPLDFMLDNLDKLQNQGDLVELKLSRAQLDSLVTDKRQYVTYQGSMNRPPCAESVDWIILNRPLLVEGTKFTQLFEKTNTNQDNIRPIKQLNNRLLRTTINNLRHKRSASMSNEPSASAGNSLEKCHKTNCNLAASAASLNKTRLSQVATPDTDHMDMKQRLTTAQHCSMKPNYAYQFSYGKLGLRTN